MTNTVLMSREALTKRADALQVIAEFLLAEVKLIRADLTAPEPKPPVPTTDEYIAQATSATAVWKALEGELGVDRRTILARVQRVVLATGLHKRYPDWSTNVGLARKLAGRRADGRRVLIAALDELK